MFDNDAHVESDLPELEAEAIAAWNAWCAWHPMSDAPRDRTYVLAIVTQADGQWEHYNGRAFVVRHAGETVSGFDLGWDLYPGFGGIPDSWFGGWVPLAPRQRDEQT